eukprot:1132100_1
MSFLSLPASFLFIALIQIMIGYGTCLDHADKYTISSLDSAREYKNAHNGKEFELHLFGIGSVGQEHHEKYLLGTLTGMTCGLIMCGVYYVYKKWKKRRFIENLMNDNNNDGDRTPLMEKV